MKVEENLNANDNALSQLGDCYDEHSSGMGAMSDTEMLTLLEHPIVVLVTTTTISTRS